MERSATSAVRPGHPQQGLPAVLGGEAGHGVCEEVAPVEDERAAVQHAHALDGDKP